MRQTAIEEQEVNINFGRNDDMVTLYSSDSTWITKLDKLVAKAPDLYKVVNDDDFGKTYTFPKKLLSLRSSIVQREYTEEQRQAMAERLKSARGK